MYRDVCDRIWRITQNGAQNAPCFICRSFAGNLQNGTETLENSEEQALFHLPVICRTRRTAERAERKNSQNAQNAQNGARPRPQEIFKFFKTMLSGFQYYISNS